MPALDKRLRFSSRGDGLSVSTPPGVLSRLAAAFTVNIGVPCSCLRSGTVPTITSTGSSKSRPGPDCVATNCNTSYTTGTRCEFTAKTTTRSVAIAKKADRTAHYVRYNCAPMPPNCRLDAVAAAVYGNAEVTLTLFTSHLVSLPAFTYSVFFSVCFVANRYILQQKYPKKLLGSCLLGRNTTVQLLTLYTDHEATTHSVTDGQTDRRSDRWTN